MAGCQDIWNPQLNRWFTVCGRILDKYNEFGGTGGRLGLPTSGEITNPDGRGKRTSFTNDSSIYWSPETDAHQIGGEIGAEWAARGYEGGPLRYPITDELTNPDGVGKHNQFQGGSIYWSPVTRAKTVWGAIRDKWAALGWETSRLGYPTGNEVEGLGGTRAQAFQQGKIVWNNGYGAFTVTTPVLNSIQSSGPIENNQQWRIPTSEQYIPWGGGIGQNFSTGSFTYRDTPFSWNYQRTFQAGSSGSYAAKGATAAQARASLMRCFNCMFPVQGATMAYPQVGQVIELKAAGVAPAPVKVIQSDPNVPAWTFEAMDGHFDGAGSVISFRIFENEGRLKLSVWAGVMNNNGRWINLTNTAFAQGYWQSFIDRIGLYMCYDYNKCQT